jgi:hypothetical protein
MGDAYSAVGALRLAANLFKAARCADAIPPLLQAARLAPNDAAVAHDLVHGLQAVTTPSRLVEGRLQGDHQPRGLR